MAGEVLVNWDAISAISEVIGVRENVLAMVNNTGLRENWIKSSGLNSEYELLGKEMNTIVDRPIQRY